LCVIDKVPRELTADQKQALRVLARHVMTQLELRRHSRELTRAHEAHGELQSELKKAQAELANARRELEKHKSKPSAKRSKR
jgi:GAF domain-containing protein